MHTVIYQQICGLIIRVHVDESTACGMSMPGFWIRQLQLCLVAADKTSTGIYRYIYHFPENPNATTLLSEVNMDNLIVMFVNWLDATYFGKQIEDINIFFIIIIIK